MDLELNTLHLMTRFAPPSNGPKKSYRDYSVYKKRIRKTTRDLLDGKKDLPDHVVGNFREYVESLVRVYEAEDIHQAYQGEYAGLPDPNEQCVLQEPSEYSIESTAHLLSTQVSPEVAVKQGLGVVTHKKEVSFPEKRRRRKNKKGN